MVAAHYGEQDEHFLEHPENITTEVGKNLTIIWSVTIEKRNCSLKKDGRVKTPNGHLSIITNNILPNITHCILIFNGIVHFDAGMYEYGLSGSSQFEAIYHSAVRIDLLQNKVKGNYYLEALC